MLWNRLSQVIWGILVFIHLFWKSWCTSISEAICFLSVCRKACQQIFKYFYYYESRYIHSHIGNIINSSKDSADLEQPWTIFVLSIYVPVFHYLESLFQNQSLYQHILLLKGLLLKINHLKNVCTLTFQWYAPIQDQNSSELNIKSITLYNFTNKFVFLKKWPKFEKKQENLRKNMEEFDSNCTNYKIC